MSTFNDVSVGTGNYPLMYNGTKWTNAQIDGSNLTSLTFSGNQNSVRLNDTSFTLGNKIFFSYTSYPDLSFCDVDYYDGLVCRWYGNNAGIYEGKWANRPPIFLGKKINGFFNNTISSAMLLNTSNAFYSSVSVNGNFRMPQKLFWASNSNYFSFDTSGSYDLTLDSSAHVGTMCRLDINVAGEMMSSEYYKLEIMDNSASQASYYFRKVSDINATYLVPGTLTHKINARLTKYSDSTFLTPANFSAGRLVSINIAVTEL
jgi:hypothetical protein